MSSRRMASEQAKTRFNPELTDSEGRTVYHFIVHDNPKALCGADMRDAKVVVRRGERPKGKAWTICPLCELQAELYGIELKPDCSGFRPISVMR